MGGPGSGRRKGGGGRALVRNKASKSGGAIKRFMGTATKDGRLSSFSIQKARIIRSKK